MSAVLTEPQLKPSANWRHSASTLFALLGSATAGNARLKAPADVTASARIRKPTEPVSTSIWSTVRQVLVAGMHTVTLTKAVLTAGVVSAPGPLSTTRVSTFGGPGVAMT